MSEPRWVDELMPDEPQWVRDMVDEELRKRDAEIERLKATNHLEIVLPPFGHGFTMPHDRLDMTALEWLREHCVIVARAEWDALRAKVEMAGLFGPIRGGSLRMVDAAKEDKR